jgi:hypothetical protein
LAARPRSPPAATYQAYLDEVRLLSGQSFQVPCRPSDGSGYGGPGNKGAAGTCSFEFHDLSLAFGLEKGIGNNRYLTFTFANTSNQIMQKTFRFQEWVSSV